MTERPKILIFGSGGQVGSELCSLLSDSDYEITAVDRGQCDLANAGSAAKLIASTEPNVVINAAAYTAVDKAESEPLLAHQLNASAPSEMARTCAERGALFVHYSTDYVFNGNNTRPWIESDPVDPINVYGKTKADGELGVIGSGAAAFIFRTSWVFGSHGANFVRTMLRLGAEREELSVVGDQVGSPTWSRSLAELTLHTIRKFTKDDSTIDLEPARRVRGVYHATGGGVATWHGFAEAIFEEGRRRGLPLKVKNVRAIGSAEYLSAAKRPKYSVLSNERLGQELGFRLADWRDALSIVMDELAANLKRG